MGFIEANKMFFKRYFDFEGRSTRPEIWWPFLLWWIVTILLAIPLGFTEETSNSETLSPMGTVFASLLGLWYFITIIPGIAVRVRRFHDQDRSGWMYLLRIVPFGGLIIIIFMCLEGTRGPNRFGPDPLGHDLGATFD